MSKNDLYSNYEPLLNLLINNQFTHNLKLHKIYRTTPVNESWRIEDNRVIDDMHMLYVIDGFCTYLLNNNKITLKKGQLIVVSNDFLHSATNESDIPLSMFSLRFGFYRNNRQIFEKSFIKNPFAVISNPIDHILYEKNLQKIYQHYIEQKPVSEFAIELLMKEILLNICEEPKNIDLSTKIKNICDKIILSHGKDITVQSLSNETDLSTKQFTKLFNKYNQITPHQFIIKTRINHGRYLLEETSLTINEIANELGYPDSFCFSKQFKKVVGISPTNYREKI